MSINSNPQGHDSNPDLWRQFAEADTPKSFCQSCLLVPLNVEVILPVALPAAIKVGMRAEVILEAPVGGRYTVKVKIVDRVVGEPILKKGLRSSYRLNPE